MPIDEYACEGKNGCGKKYEILLTHTERKIYTPECPHCGATDGLKKLISGTHFELKGGGWYEDGYASKK